MLVRGAGKPSPAFTTDDVVARVYGDTVILTGRVVTRRKRADGTTSESASRYTDTYVRRNGRWQVASSHLGKVKGEK
jgi:ketosteroid isomerase-like protein